MNICFIINPNSGKKKALQIFKSIKPILNKKNITFDLFNTDYKEHAINITRKLDFTKYHGIIIAP